MERRQGITRSGLLLVLLLVFNANPVDSRADAGDFWYGFYNVQIGSTSAWKDSTFRVMAERYKMNYALTSLTEDLAGSGLLDSARTEGVRIMQWIVTDDTLADSALIFRKYSNTMHLIFQAEGDTILYQYNTEEPYGGIYVYHGENGAGAAVYDPHDAGNFLWGMAIRELNIPYFHAHAAVELFSIFFGELAYSGEFKIVLSGDDPGDRRARLRGYLHKDRVGPYQILIFPD